MHNRIKICGVLGVLLLLLGNTAYANAPSVADLDASARAAGNRLDVAVRVGERIFNTMWPAQISQISANQVGTHLIVGIRLWGVKFHRPLTRSEFVTEIAALVNEAFAAAPQAEEVDVWTSVPLNVGKGMIVSGDLAIPTSRTVFSITARRGESPAALAARAFQGSDVYWDEDWERTAFRG